MPGPVIRNGCIPRTSGTGLNQTRTQVDCFDANGKVWNVTPAEGLDQNYSGLVLARDPSSPDPQHPIIALIDPVINARTAPFMAAYPLGNQPSTAIAHYADSANPDGTVNLAIAHSQVTNQNYYLARFDQTLSSNDNFFFRYKRDAEQEEHPSFEPPALTESAT